MTRWRSITLGLENGTFLPFSVFLLLWFPRLNRQNSPSAAYTNVWLRRTNTMLSNRGYGIRPLVKCRI